MTAFYVVECCPEVARSPLLAAIVPTAAVIAAFVRWWQQGSGNVYTALDKRFYVSDPDLGWRALSDGPLWLGLDLIAVLGGALLAVFVGALLIRRRESRIGSLKWGRIALWCIASLTFVVPAAAFVSGGRPPGAVDFLPEGAAAAAPTSGIEGRLDVPSGAYRVVSGTASAITARIRAGGDRFDARFSGGLSGTVSANWRDFGAAPRELSARISVDSSSVDTGIDLRSKHAREEYLAVAEHPQIAFALSKLIAARQDRPDTVAFRAQGTISLLGRDVAVEVTGSVRAISPQAAARLSVRGQSALLVHADTALSLSATPLAGDNSFDDDRVPIVVTLLLVSEP